MKKLAECADEYKIRKKNNFRKPGTIVGAKKDVRLYGENDSIIITTKRRRRKKQFATIRCAI